LNLEFFVPAHTRIRDWGQRAQHLLNVVGREIVRIYYGDQPDYAYFQGCSTGGRQGLMELQKYPSDYDGIIASAPAAFIARLNMSAVFNVVMNIQLARDDSAISAKQQDLLADSVLAACDGLDGLEDRIIDDPLQCEWNPAEIQCVGGEDPDSCLSPRQVEHVRYFYEGSRTADGGRFYSGYAYGSEGSWRLSEDCGRFCDRDNRGVFLDPNLNVLEALDSNL